MKIVTPYSEFKMENGRSIYFNTFSAEWNQSLFDEVKKIIKLDWPVRFFDPNIGKVCDTDNEADNVMAMRASHAMILHIDELKQIPHQLFSLGYWHTKYFFIVSNYPERYLKHYTNIIGGSKIFVCEDYKDLAIKIAEWLTKELVVNVTVQSVAKATPNMSRL